MSILSRGFSYYLKKGLKAFENAEYENALKMFSRTINTNKQSTQAYYARGNTYFKLVQYKNAIADYDVVIKLDNKNSKAYNNRGNAKFELGLYAEAIADYDCSLKIKDIDLVALNNKSHALLKLGKYQESIRGYEQVIRISPSYHYAYVHLASSFYKLSKYQDAIINYKKSLELKPNFYSSYTGLGKCYFELGKYLEAVESFQSSLKLKFHVDVLKDICLIYEKLGDVTNQLVYYKKLFDVDTDNVAVIKKLVILNKSVKNKESELFFLEQLLSLGYKVGAVTSKIEQLKEEIKEEAKAEEKEEIKEEAKAEEKEEIKEEAKAEEKEEIKEEAKAEEKEEIKEEAKAEEKEEIKEEAKAEEKEEIKEEAKAEEKEEIKEEAKAEEKEEIKEEAKAEEKEEIKEEAKAEEKEEIKEEAKAEEKEEVKEEAKAEEKEEIKEEAKAEEKEEIKEEAKAEEKEEIKEEAKAEEKEEIKEEAKAEEKEEIKEEAKAEEKEEIKEEAKAEEKEEIKEEAKAEEKEEVKEEAKAEEKEEIKEEAKAEEKEEVKEEKSKMQNVNFTVLDVLQENYLPECVNFENINFSFLFSDKNSDNLSSEMFIDDKFFHYYNRGNAKFKLKKYEEAIEDYNQSIILDSSNFHGHICRGDVFFCLSQYKSSILDYDKAIQLNPGYWITYVCRGNAKFMLGDYEGSIIDYNNAVKLSCESFGLFYNRGNANFKLGKCKEAIVDYDKAIQLCFTDNTLYHNRGNANFKLGKYKEAIVDYDKAIQLKPLFQSYNARGNVRVRMSQDAFTMNAEKQVYVSLCLFALQDYNISISKDDSAYSYAWRGAANLLLNDYESAKKDYNRAIMLQLSSCAVYAGRAKCFFHLGNYENAIYDYNLAINLDSSSADLFFGRGCVFIKLNKYLDALKDYDKFLLLNSKDYRGYYKRGMVLSKLDKYKEAIENYDHSIILNTEHVDSYAGRANAKYHIGKYEEAIQDYDYSIVLGRKQVKDILQVQPIDSSLQIDLNKKKEGKTHRYKADINLNVCRYDDAIQEYLLAIQENEMDHLSCIGLAISKFKLAQYDVALEMFNKAAEIHPDWVSFLGCGNVNLKLCNYQEAIRFYEKSVAENELIIDYLFQEMMNHCIGLENDELFIRFLSQIVNCKFITSSPKFFYITMFRRLLSLQALSIDKLREIIQSIWALINIFYSHSSSIADRSLTFYAEFSQLMQIINDRCFRLDYSSYIGSHIEEQFSRSRDYKLSCLEDIAVYVFSTSVYLDDKLINLWNCKGFSQNDIAIQVDPDQPYSFQGKILNFSLKDIEFFNVGMSKNYYNRSLDFKDFLFGEVVYIGDKRIDHIFSLLDTIFGNMGSVQEQYQVIFKSTFKFILDLLSCLVKEKPEVYPKEYKIVSCHHRYSSNIMIDEMNVKNWIPRAYVTTPKIIGGNDYKSKFFFNHLIKNYYSWKLYLEQKFKQQVQISIANSAFQK